MIYSPLGYFAASLLFLLAPVVHSQALVRSASLELLTGNRYEQPILRKNIDAQQQPRDDEAFPHASRAMEMQDQKGIHDKNDLTKWAIDISHASESHLSRSEHSLRMASHSHPSKRQYGPAQIARQFLRIGVVQISTLAYIRYPEFNPTVKNVTEPWVAPIRKMYEIIRYKATHDWSNLAERGYLLIWFGPFKLELEQPDGKTIPWVLIQNWSDEALIGMLIFNGVVFTGWRYWANIAGMWIYATLTYGEECAAC